MIVLLIHMNKTLSALLAALFIVQFAALPVQALEIVVNKSGALYFYESNVLGEKTEKIEEKKGEVKAEVRQRTQTETPIKVVPSNTKSKIRLKTENNETEVTVEKAKVLKGEKKEGQVTKAERVEMQLPAELKPSSPLVEEKKRMEKKPEASPSPEPSPETRNPEEIKEERRERKNEMVEIRTQLNADGKTEFEFESRLVKAKAQGAEFIIDPATNNITVITPSGNEHVLTHLPDQAIAQMQASGVVNTDPITNGTAELQIETKDDGSVVYSTTSKRAKKILWFFNRNVDTKVELNDQTGEIVEKEVPATSLVDKLLNALSK